ncbi:MAG: peptide-methionine (R)-S-oxide reductase MsrB [Chlamydiales bacterium]
MKATLAGGCFWCIESAFRKVLGVTSTRCGYTGGTHPNPTYEEVCRGDTGHVEAVEVEFDPERITFLQILDIFWRQIDPLDARGQFADRGSSYQTVIFYHDEKQKILAEKSKASIQKGFDRPVATKILPAKPFYPAEESHQNYCLKQPERYKHYRSGHEKQLQQIWQDKTPSQEDLREKLTPLQYKVTQEEETEPPFKNEYWENKEEGIYVDVVSGEPLFASTDKFDSKSGWPSFTQPIRSESLDEHDDWKLGSRRTEIRGKKSNAHLGHLFPDGPLPNGMRYCINSAALRFIPKDKMEEEGYGEYLSLFQ